MADRRPLERAIAATNLLPGPASTPAFDLLRLETARRRRRAAWRCLLHPPGPGPHPGAQRPLSRRLTAAMGAGSGDGRGRRRPAVAVSAGLGVGNADLATHPGRSSPAGAALRAGRCRGCRERRPLARTHPPSAAARSARVGLTGRAVAPPLCTAGRCSRSYRAIRWHRTLVWTAPEGWRPLLRRRLRDHVR